MNPWDLIDRHMHIVIIIFVACFLLVVGVIIFAFPKLTFLYKLYKETKKESELANSKKAVKKLLRKHPLVFSSSTADNDWGYKEIKKHFDEDSEIVFIEQDCRDFDAKFDKYDIVVYKVLDAEFGIPCKVKDPLYKRISKYCSDQQNYCILVCMPGKHIDISENADEFNPIYVTTVMFYSKLRETLHILLNFAP